MMACMIQLWVALSILTGAYVRVTTASVTVEQRFSLVHSGTPSGVSLRDLLSCAAICARDATCAAFEGDISGYCALLLDSTGLSSGVVYEKVAPFAVTTTTVAPTTTALVPVVGRTSSMTCYSYLNQIEYMGTQNNVNGVPCKKWSELSYVMPDEDFPGGSNAGALNYCRSPGFAYGSPYCYVKSDISAVDPLKLCGIPIC